MKRSNGFTVIEIIIAIVFIGAVAVILLIQKANLSATQRDDHRKTAINAMYYNLEEVFYEQNGYYPVNIDSKTLRAMDPALFTDPDGIKMNEQGSDYHYVGMNCETNSCKSYKLSAELEKEATYVKTNRN